MLTPGQQIDRYELICPIGDGGMASVWAARQHGKHGFEKLFALKIIHSRFAEDPTFRAMFLDEARIVAQIDHRNVAQVFDLGEFGSLLYLVMEYVDGDSLSGLIAPKRTVPLPVALRITAEACAGAHAAHLLVDANGRPRNVVHRDISPQNILLSRRGEVKLIDFGIALARDRAAASTAIGTVKGKARYMAPEQARREDIGPHSDVFGIGAVLFRMLSGHAPYAAANDIATMQALLASAPPLWRLPESLPSPVVAIVHRAIAPDLRERYTTAEELKLAVEAALASLGPPDLVAWINANLTERARERHRALAARNGVLVSESPAPAPRPHVTDSMPPVPEIMHPPPEAAPRALPSQDNAPGFMDVKALVAQARDGDHGAAGKQTNAASNSSSAKPESSTADAGPRYVGPATPAVKSSKSSIGTVLKAAILVVVLVLATIGVLLLLPMVARDRAIATARDAGFEITIERVGVGLDGVTLRGVTATTTRIPGFKATISEIFSGGFTNKDIRLHGMDVTLVGPRSDVQPAVAALVADNRRRLAGVPESPRHVSIVSARLRWEGVTGEGSRLSAGEIGVEIDSHGAGTEAIRGAVGGVELKTKRTTFGPWAASFESSTASSRLRLMFDPPVPDGPSLLYVSGREVPPEITLRIPRSPFVHLGIRPTEIGIPADGSTELEAKIDGKFPPQSRAEVKIDVTLWRARPTGFKSGIDIHAEGTATGAPDKPLNLEKSSVTIGPVVAAITGTIAPHDAGVRLDALFKTLPMTCATLARAEAQKMGTLVQALQTIGEATGALRVTGTLNASGAVKYDTADPEDASVTWLAKETCGVSIFGL